MVRVEFFSSRGTKFTDQILLQWIEQETHGWSDFTLAERATKAFGENLWVIDMCATRQGEHVDAPAESTIVASEIDDDPASLRLDFSE